VGASLKPARMMVACYLIAMLMGILLLGYLTAPRPPSTATVAQLLH